MSLADDLAARPAAPVLLVCGPTAVAAAIELLPSYIVASWATADYFSKDPGAPITNGELSPLAGRRVDLWTSTRAERWPHAATVRELLSLNCQLRLIEPTATENIEPGVAKLAGWDAAKLIEFARSRVRSVTEAPNSPPETAAAEDQEPAPFEPPTTWEQPDDDRWEPPINLWTARPTVPLVVTALPPRLREFVAESSDLIGCESTVVGLSALVVAASVIDDNFRVQPKEHDTSWTESARLWSAIVGDPSSKKSPGMRAAMAPLRAIDARLAAAHADAMRDFQADLEAHAQARGKDKGPPPQKPASERVLTQNATVEALSDILVDNPRGLLVAPDELSGWFGAMDVYSKGGSKDRGLWLEAYNGGPQRVDRVTRGQLFVPNWSTCILGGIQPDVFGAVAKRIDNDGLLQRFMVVMASRSGKDQDRKPDTRIINDYHKTIYQLREMRASGEEIYRLDPEAQIIRRTFMEMIDQSAETELPRGMAGYLGKWSGLFARLLCAYHLIEYAGRTPPPFVSAETAMQVCELMESCLYQHAHQFYGEMLGRGESDEHVAWIAGHILATNATEITTREISQRYKHFNRLTDQLHRSIWLRLEQYQWIRPHPTARTNKRSNLPTRWDVNPFVHTSFKTQAATERRTRAASRNQISIASAERRGDKDE